MTGPAQELEAFIDEMIQKAQFRGNHPSEFMRLRS